MSEQNFLYCLAFLLALQWVRVGHVLSQGQSSTTAGTHLAVSARARFVLTVFNAEGVNVQAAGNCYVAFQVFSLCPPACVHDVSFWVPDGEQFDEVAFHTIARQVSGEMVVSIQLIDSFQQSETGRKSLCYRLTFQSCDKALSRQEVAEMQLLFRKEIKQHLRVALR